MSKAAFLESLKAELAAAQAAYEAKLREDARWLEAAARQLHKTIEVFRP